MKQATAMLSPHQIQAIAHHQRLRGVEVTALRAGTDGVRIRMARPPVAPTQAQEPPAALPAPPHTGVLVRSGQIGQLVLADHARTGQPVKAGDAVRQGQVMALVACGQAVAEVQAPADPTVAAVLVHPGQRIDYGMALFELAPAGEGAA